MNLIEYRYSNEDIIRENIIQKNKISSLKNRLSYQNEKIERLQKQINQNKVKVLIRIESQNKNSNKRNMLLQANKVDISIKPTDLQSQEKKCPFLKNDSIQEIDSSIYSELSTLSEIVINIIVSVTQEVSDRKTKIIVEKCILLGCRMIDTICDSIPEWEKASMRHFMI